ncbi:Rne/Rng family ribonuclease [Thermocrinis sp.]|uniref:Rne/Rng family ribonuclease n=1 Tax=Thermocrinis sp. TaxID=2024383 RepID=UPI002FDD5CF0
MAKKLVVLTHQDTIFSFLFEGEEVIKVRVDKKGASKLVGSIFKGKVKRLAKGMGGVFIDIGLEKEAYLPLKGEEVKVGESLLVQVVREGIGEKGAKLTTKIKIPGKYIVYMPESQEVKCSSKLSKEEKWDMINFIADHLDKEGVILRTPSARAKKEEILKELEVLRKTYMKLKDQLEILKKPQILWEDPPEYLSLIRSYWYDMETIFCNDVEIWYKIMGFLEEFERSLMKRVFYIKQTHDAFLLKNALRKISQRYVWLRGGGYIVIDETEAMTVIDVNSGDPCGDTQEENALKTNLEAAEEIAKQIVLRDLGGIIMIDFIDMKSQENKDKVMNALKEALRDDLCNVQIYGFTKLGVLEMARKRAGKSVPELLFEKCPLCSGLGKVKGNALYSFELSLEIQNYPAGFLEIFVPKGRKRAVEESIKGLDNVKVVEKEDLDYNNYEVRYER